MCIINTVQQTPFFSVLQNEYQILGNLSARKYYVILSEGIRVWFCCLQYKHNVGSLVQVTKRLIDYALIQSNCMNTRHYDVMTSQNRPVDKH
jgi:hypothetical protein